MYLSATPPILVFNRRAPARIIREGVDSTKDEVRKSTMNILWSPTPYPAGMTQAPVTTVSGVAHTPWMAFVPRKNVAPRGSFVNVPTTSFIARPPGLVRDLPRLFFINVLVRVHAYN